MANGFGSLYVGASGLQSQQNALNVVANNLSNVNTKGYVRQQVFFTDTDYTTFANADISAQQLGLGVQIGDVIHARDQFLDKAYRSEAGRQAFYAASYDATSEIETQLQESYGEAFNESVMALYQAFSEFAKNPSDAVNQNLVMQKASLFVTRVDGVYEGMKTYQTTLNQKITDDVKRINELGRKIADLNLRIQRVEAPGVETAMDYRDERDLYVDELSKLASIECRETPDGVYKIDLEGTEFISYNKVYEMDMRRDAYTGFLTPYWPQLSEPAKEKYFNVFDEFNATAENRTDSGEAKALILARGNKYANYLDMEKMDDYVYSDTIAKSAMLNGEAELDRFTHTIVTAINDLFCPNVAFGSIATATAQDGSTINLSENTLVLDAKNCAVGSDGQLPPQELFSRIGCERYTKATLEDGTTVYVFNEEDPFDTSKCYTINSLKINPALQEDESLIPYKTQNGSIAMDLAASLESIWDQSTYTLNPSDNTPCTFTEFYTKMIGELGTRGSIYNSTAEGLTATVSTIDNNRTMVVGVSADEELTNMIKYQAAYNAASRYINVISSMIETLVNTMQ